MKYNDDYIYIRPIKYSDTDNIIKWRNSDFVRHNFIYQGLFTRESHENWMRTMVETKVVVQMIICLKEGDIPVGSVYIRDIDYELKEGEYGIFIGEDSYRGKGIGTRAAKLMLTYAKEEIGLHKLFLRAFEDNVGALNSYIKAGFVPMDRNEMVNINGIDRNVVFMSTDLL